MDDPGRRVAEEGLCLLAVLDALLNHLGCVEQDVSQQLSASVVNMLNRQRFLQVVAVGCQLLCTLARMHARAAGQVTQLANKVYNIASGLLSIVQPAPGSGEYRTLQQGPRWVGRWRGWGITQLCCSSSTGAAIGAIQVLQSGQYRCCNRVGSHARLCCMLLLQRVAG